MKGMEMMLASMLGITPDEMKQTIGNAVDLLGTINERFNAIEQNQAEILALLKGEVKTNDASEHA